MNKREGAIISAYTGILIGKFDDFHKYVEEIMNRPVLTHELADEKVFARIKELSKNDFLNIKIDD